MHLAFYISSNQQGIITFLWDSLIGVLVFGEPFALAISNECECINE